MTNQLILSWLYWDPERIVFTVPIIDRPVVWYGLLFVLGFMIGYFIIAYMFNKKILSIPEICPTDITNWPLLIEELQKIENPIIGKLNSQAKKELRNNETSESSKSAIFNAINICLKNGEINRKALQERFPKAILSARDLSMKLADRLSWFAVAGTIIGARLGEVFFYNWPEYSAHPERIIRVWDGGLASHGGTIGVILALSLYYMYLKKHVAQINFLNLLDMVCVPTALVSCFIRIGNFTNQEILGTESDVPWAVIFGRPADHSPIVPRHPVQLYEAACYLITFIFVSLLWKKKGLQLKPGIIIGLFTILVFGSRFFVEFLKLPENAVLDQSYLYMGQILSIPFVLAGIAICFAPKGKRRSQEPGARSQ